MQNVISKFYSSIPTDWKKAFIVALLINFFVFSYGMMQYPLGDHDVGYLKGIFYLSGGAIGRWASPIVYSLSGFLQVPVYTQTLAIIFQIMAAMLAVLTWNQKASFSQLFCGGLLVSLIPFVNEHYYYHWMVAVFAISQFCMVLSLFILRYKSICCFFSSIILIVFALALYQPSCLTWGVLVLGLLASKVLDSPGDKNVFCIAMEELPRPFAVLIIALFLYLLSLLMIEQLGYLRTSSYQFGFLGEDFFNRALVVIKASFAHMWYTQPYSPRLLKLLLLGCCLIGAFGYLYEAVHKRSHFLFLFMLIIFVLIIISSKALFLISSYNGLYEYRIASFGLSYTYLFFLMGFFYVPYKRLRRVGACLFALVIVVFAVNDLRAQEQIVHSNLHDFAVLNRVVAKVESLENFDPDVTYNIIQFGKTKPYIPTLYDEAEYDQGGPTFYRGTVSQAWAPGHELSLLSAYLHFDLRMNETGTQANELLLKAANASLGRRPFPHQESCFIIDDNTLVLIFDENTVAFALEREDLNVE